MRAQLYIEPNRRNWRLQLQSRITGINTRISNDRYLATEHRSTSLHAHISFRSVQAGPHIRHELAKFKKAESGDRRGGFTDHLAVCLRLSSELPILRTGRGMWKMDNDVLIEITSTNKMRTLWERLQRHKRHNSDKTM